MSSDRRTKYTKMFLKEAILDLLQEKPLHKVTVTELCQISEINRTTFYRYYADPFDLFDQIKEEFVHDLKNYGTLKVDDPCAQDGVSAVRNVCKFYQKNKRIYLTLMEILGEGSFLDELIQASKANVKQNWDHQKIATKTPETEYVIYYIWGACNSVFYHWLKYEEEKYTADEIGDLIIKMNYNGLKEL